jgi:hypothetical protein
MSEGNGTIQPVDQRRIVRRDAYICVHCEGVYADEPVAQCDCLDALKSSPPHFVKGSIDYILPNDKIHP